MLTLENIKEYLRIDFNEDDNILSSMLEESEIYIDSCVGEGYKINPKLVKLSELLQKKLVADMYENRNSMVESKFSRDIITRTILQKLALESGDTSG